MSNFYSTSNFQKSFKQTNECSRIPFGDSQFTHQSDMKMFKQRSKSDRCREKSQNFDSNLKLHLLATAVPHTSSNESWNDIPSRFIQYASQIIVYIKACRELVWRCCPLCIRGTYSNAEATPD